MWYLKNFASLTTRELFEIYKARVDTFVVEQNCPYPEVDDADLLSLHLFNKNNGIIEAYCRIIPDGNQVKIGRVLVNKTARQKGYGRQILARALEACNERFPNLPVFIQAQTYLQSFYASFGFKPISDDYLEDGISHIDMILEN